MTRQQAICLDIIRRLTRGGVAPSYDEIAAQLRVSKTTAHALVRGLAEAGAVRLGRGWRQIVVVDPLSRELARLVALHGAEAVRDGLDAVTAGAD